MTRHVVPGAEVPHLFAAQAQDFAYNSCRNIRFEGKTLYSYQEPIAHIHESGLVMMSDDKFSVTTSKHQRWTRYALRHMPGQYFPRLKKLLNYRDEGSRLEYLAHIAGVIAELDSALLRLRADHKKTHNRGEAESLSNAAQFVWATLMSKPGNWRQYAGEKEKFDKAAKIACYTQAANNLAGQVDRFPANYAELLQHLAESDEVKTYPYFRLSRLERFAESFRYADSVKLDSATGADFVAHMSKKAVKEYKANVAKLAAYMAPLLDEIKAAQAERDKAREIELQESAESWLSLQSDARPYGFPRVLCRVKDERVETSKGAQVPLAHALQDRRCIILQAALVIPFRAETVDHDGAVPRLHG